MTHRSLTVTPRTLSGRKVKKLRREGQVPASIFGKKIPTSNIQVDSKEFLKVYKEVGESSLIYLGDRPVLVSDVTYHPVTGLVLHVSFRQVDLKAKVTAPVAIKLLGDAPAEQEKLGIMVQQLDEVEIEALPTDMPEDIKVDVSVLNEVGSQIMVGELKLDSSKLTIKTEPTVIIVKIEALAKEEAAPEVVQIEGAVPSEVEGSPSTQTPAPAAETKAEEK